LVWPWFAMLAASASIAYGTTAAVTGGKMVGPSQIVTTVTDSRGESEDCNAPRGWTLYVGLNTWIPVPSAIAPCGHMPFTGE
jgi:hypothetical protein